MKHLILFLILSTFSISAFAQFPLGSDINEIKAYFDNNVPYASAQTFKTSNGTNALCFTKVRVVGDYTFFFDFNGLCTSYIVTYDEKELPEVTRLFDKKYCRTQMDKWTAEDDAFDIKLVLPKKGENFISLVYKPMPADTYSSSALASN